jgi:N-alpha-acetyltransferase 35, NatC auxiliary subunit
MSDQKSHVEHLDVQPFLQSVCDGMQVDELLCQDNFNLHDAMIAIEIGDPKMDVGLRRGDTRSLEELIAAGLAPVDISLELQLAVIDRLMCMESTWHNGVVLSQTVFTSLYLLDTER